MKRAAIVLAGFVVAGTALVLAAPSAIQWVEKNQAIAERKDEALPPPVRKASSSSRPAPVVSSSTSEPPPTPPPPSSDVRAAVNWDVPFTSQAPTGVWDPDHKEACEEASVLMVLRYFEDRPFTSVEDADASVIALVRANEELGYAVDITAAQVIDLLQSQNSSLDAELLHNPSVDDLKEVLSEGKLVIVPAQGQLLGNPYFQHPGPPYHMLVLRGYTENGRVITNDPGTKRGEQFTYTWDVLMNAMHDWNGGDVMSGAKVVVVVGE